MIKLIIKTDSPELLEHIINSVEEFTNKSLKEVKAGIKWEAIKDGEIIGYQKINFEVEKEIHS